MKAIMIKKIKFREVYGKLENFSNDLKNFVTFNNFQLEEEKVEKLISYIYNELFNEESYLTDIHSNNICRKIIDLLNPFFYRLKSISLKEKPIIGISSFNSEQPTINDDDFDNQNAKFQNSTINNDNLENKWKNINWVTPDLSGLILAIKKSLLIDYNQLIY